MTRMIQTFTGAMVDPLALDDMMIRIEDIAHALSLKCRFNGHCAEFYSVAQHSLIVCEHTPEPYKLQALLHDAAEAYLPDVAAPIKGQVLLMRESDAEKRLEFWPASHFSNVRPAQALTTTAALHTIEYYEERIVQAVIAELTSASMSPEAYAAIKNADLLALAAEARDLMNCTTRWPGLAMVPELNYRIVPMAPAAAERQFLEKFRELQARCSKPA